MYLLQVQPYKCTNCWSRIRNVCIQMSGMVSYWRQTKENPTLFDGFMGSTLTSATSWFKKSGIQTSQEIPDLGAQLNRRQLKT